MPNTYSSIRRNVRLDLTHEVFFTRDAFDADNSTLSDLLKGDKLGNKTKAIVYLDEGILDGNPNILTPSITTSRHTPNLWTWYVHLLLYAEEKMQKMSGSWSKLSGRI